MSLSFAVTGSSGYIGSCLSEYLEGRGHRVLRLQRLAGAGRTAAYSLEKGCDAAALAGVDVLVHAAYDFKVAGWDAIRRVNVEGSARLFDTARAAGVGRIVFISSIASFERARSLYGQAKFLTEKEAAARGGIVLRPGLVYGKRPGGVFGALKKLAWKAPVVPLIGRGCQELNLLHEEDFCRAVERAAECAAPPDGPVYVAQRQALVLADIMKMLISRGGKRKMLIPVPVWLILLGLRTAELLRVPVGFRSDSLISILNQNKELDFSRLDSMGIAVRKFDPSDL